MPGRNEPCPCGSGKKYKKCCANVILANGLPSQEIDLNVALSHLKKGNFSNAVKIAAAYLQTNRNDAAARMVLGVSLYHLNEFSKAEDAFRQIIKREKNNPDAWNNLGLVLCEQDKLSDALLSCQQALRLQSNMPGALNNLGNIYRKQRNYNKAQIFYQQAINAGMQLPESYCNLGVVQDETGDTESARQSYLSALNLEQNFTPAMSNLAVQLLHQGKFKEAKIWLTKAIMLDPDDADILCNLGMYWKAVGNYSAAVPKFVKALTREPHHLTALAEISEIMLEQNQMSRAEYYLEVAVQAGGLADVKVAKVYCKYLIDNQHYKKILSIWKKLLLKHPGNKIVYCGYADYYIALGDYNQAQSFYEKYLTTNKDDCTVLLEWAVMEESRHNLRVSGELVSRILSINPGHSQARLMLAKILSRKKEYEQALIELDKISIEDAASAASHIFYERGAILDRLKRFAEAYKDIDKACEFKNQLMGNVYQSDKEQRYFDEYCEVFKVNNKKILPYFEIANVDDTIKPIFIVGFPRSGTTLVEQILSAHSHISAGDELPFVDEIKNKISLLTGSDKMYPLNLVDQLHKLEQASILKLRHYYLSRVKEKEIAKSTNGLFTDKLPHNLRNLGLINILFPEAAIIHVIRHPMDACLSAYMANFNDSSGHYYTSSMENTTMHYALMMKLAEFYKSTLDMKYLHIRYEDIVSYPEEKSRELVDFIGLSWEDTCLKFYENKHISKTSSYAQVTQKIYTSSCYRYKNYFEQLQPYAEILAEAMENFEYTFEP